jgi:hypothetical protein
MCIVLSGETQPDTTKLMNVPVVVDGVKSNFFMYINNFDLNNPIMNSNMNKFNSLLDDNQNGMFSRLYQDLNTFNLKNNLGNSSIMVVPFAVDPHTPTSQIGLVDISTNEMKKLRKNIESLKPVSKSYMYTNESRSYSLGVSKVLEVHKIGNYNISVATSRTKLLNNIDWTKFTKPDDYEERVRTFSNKNLYPDKYAYFYIVASAIENIKDDGFGIVYPRLSDGNIYIPTAHEDTSQTHEFDVELFAFGKNLHNRKNLHNGMISNVSDKSVCYDFLSEISDINVKILNNTYKKMDFDKDINTFYYDKIEGMEKNHNIFLN